MLKNDTEKIDAVLIRMDRLGDLVLSLPADESPLFWDRKCHWFITSGLGFVPQHAVPRRNFTEFERSFSLKSFWTMVRWLKRASPEWVIVFHAPWWVSLAVWWAKIPLRIGRKSQWHSFLFFNLGVRQKRSLSERHESDYNFQLLEVAFGKLGVRPYSQFSLFEKKWLQLKAPDQPDLLKKWGLTPKGYRVVHPGMGGSALNWPIRNYAALIKKLTTDSHVVITGTKSDEEMITHLHFSLKDEPKITWLTDQLSGPELLVILENAQSVTAPSTGVLHLAASLKTPTIGIYSPRTVERPVRWGPKGPFTQTLVPETLDPNPKPEIMETISPKVVNDVIRQTESTAANA